MGRQKYSGTNLCSRDSPPSPGGRRPVACSGGLRGPRPHSFHGSPPLFPASVLGSCCRHGGARGCSGAWYCYVRVFPDEALTAALRRMQRVVGAVAQPTVGAGACVLCWSLRRCEGAGLSGHKRASNKLPRGGRWAGGRWAGKWGRRAVGRRTVGGGPARGGPAESLGGGPAGAWGRRPRPRRRKEPQFFFAIFCVIFSAIFLEGGIL